MLFADIKLAHQLANDAAKSHRPSRSVPAAGAAALAIWAWQHAYRETTMDEIEARLHLPKGAQPLDRYTRFYYREGDLVVAVYVEEGVYEEDNWADALSGQRRWREQWSVPRIMDYGCSVLHLRYDPASKTVEGPSCGYYL